MGLPSVVVIVWQAFASVRCGGRNVTCTSRPSGYESLFWWHVPCFPRACGESSCLMADAAGRVHFALHRYEAVAVFIITLFRDLRLFWRAVIVNCTWRRVLCNASMCLCDIPRLCFGMCCVFVCCYHACISWQVPSLLVLFFWLNVLTLEGVIAASKML